VHPALRVNADRLRADFEALAQIGWSPPHGLGRVAFSAAHVEARAWLLARGRAAGLQARVDTAGNHSLVLPARDPAARTLLLGSHLDSVPHGGRYDGALGVVCALEVVRAVQDHGVELPVTLEAIDFTDEEGTLLGTLGSRALAGELSTAMLAEPRGGRELLVRELARMELTTEGLLAARRPPESLACFVELHIEQGPVLEAAGVDIGVVTGIRGNCSYEVVFQGDAAHAGTTPMDVRRDAGLGAAAFVLGVRETVVRDYPSCVANVGKIELEPGAFNVVPGRARVAMECRSLDGRQLDALADALLARARAEAAARGLVVEVRRVGRWDPTVTDPRVRAAISRAATELGLSSMELPSGAGHDAQVLARRVPSGMVFVPSAGGISHHPSEHTAWQQCVDGANVLLGAIVELARGCER
jgi:N-carbamoyl-L-amino-acid hydrolase